MSDEAKLRRLQDLMHQAQKTWQPVITDFMPREQAEDFLPTLRQTDLYTRLWGGWEGAERVRLAFSMLEDIADEDFNIQLMALDGPAKYLKADHRDYLGAILSLGFTRDKMGDILVRDGGCEFFIDADLTSYLALADLRVRHVPVQIKPRDLSTWLAPEVKTETVEIIVPGMRLDAVMAKAFHLSRRQCNELIEAGRVRINHDVEWRSHQLLQPGDLLAVRGQGRIRIGEITGVTKKDNRKLLIELYL